MASLAAVQGVDLTADWQTLQAAGVTADTLALKHAEGGELGEQPIHPDRCCHLAATLLLAILRSTRSQPFTPVALCRCHDVYLCLTAWQTHHQEHHPAFYASIQPITAATLKQYMVFLEKRLKGYRTVVCTSVKVRSTMWFVY